MSPNTKEWLCKQCIRWYIHYKEKVVEKGGSVFEDDGKTGKGWDNGKKEEKGFEKMNENVGIYQERCDMQGCNEEEIIEVPVMQCAELPELSDTYTKWAVGLINVISPLPVYMIP